MTTRIRTRAHIDAAAAELAAICPHMAMMVGALEQSIPLRLAKPGYEELARMIVAQQVSVGSAAAIWSRVQGGLGEVTPEAVLRKRDASLQGMGLSRPKVRYVKEVARAIVEHRLRLGALARMDTDDAIAHMTAVPGIGQWTAEIYLMFCLGRPDIFPAGDIALQNTYRDVAGLAARPTKREMAEIAQTWSPWRAVAARVLWSYLREQRMKQRALNNQTYP